MSEQPAATSSSRSVGWKAELGLIVLVVTTGILVAFVIYLPIEGRAVSVAASVAIVLTASATIWWFVELLKRFDIQFLGLPSTWLILVAFFLSIAFAMFSQNEPWVHYPSVAEAASLAGIILCSVVSAVTNIRRTSFLFGMTLTFIQILLSVLAVAGFVVFVLLKFVAQGAEQSDKKKSSTNASGSTQNSDDMDRMRMF